MISKSVLASLMLVSLLSLLSGCTASASYYNPHFPSSYNHPISRDSDAATVGKVVVAAGCVAAIGYGLYKLFDWLFTPTNEQIIQNGRAALQNVHANGYDELRGWMQDSLSQFPENPYEQECLIKQVNERLLYSLAAQFDCSLSLNTLESLLRNVCTNHQAVIDRLKKLQSKPDVGHIIGQLQSLERELCSVRFSLQFMRDYLSRHQSYFFLYEREGRLIRTYEQELVALRDHYSNPAYLRELVRVCVMRNATDSRNAFPYMQYGEKIKGDCNALDHALKNVNFNYADRIGAARSLLQQLQSIYNLIIIEDAYHQELRDYERAQIEKQKLEAQKAQAAAAAAQAAAMQQQVWQMQQQNALHAQQIQATHQQNALLATNALVNAINPQPQVHVYL